MEKVRKHIIFYGYVQGVGFRYRASHTARQYGISGWVRNLDDGSVEMEAEGTEKDIADLLWALEQHAWGHIDRIASNKIPLHGDYGFEIK